MPAKRTASASMKKKRTSRAATPETKWQWNHYDRNLKKPRKRTSTTQLDILEHEYTVAGIPKPGRLRRDELAAQLGREWSQRDVQVWFQNRRAKDKRLARKADASGAAGLSSTTEDGSGPDDALAPPAAPSPQIKLTLPAPDVHPDGQRCSEPPPECAVPFGASPESSAGALHTNANQHAPPVAQTHASEMPYPLSPHRRESLPVPLVSAHDECAGGFPPGFNPIVRRASESEDQHTLRHVQLLSANCFAPAVRMRNGWLAYPPPVDGELGVLPDPGDLSMLPDPQYSFGTPEADQHELAPESFAYPMDGSGFKEEMLDSYALPGYPAQRGRHGSIASNTSTLYSESTTLSRRSSVDGLAEDARRGSVTSTASMLADMSLRCSYSMASSQPASRRASHAQLYVPPSTDAQAYMQSTISGSNMFGSTQNYSFQSAAGPSSYRSCAEFLPDGAPSSAAFNLNTMPPGQEYYPGSYLAGDHPMDEYATITLPVSSHVEIPLLFANYNNWYHNPSFSNPLPPIYEYAVESAGAVELDHQCVPAPSHEAQLLDPVPVLQSTLFGKNNLHMHNFP